MHLRWSSARGMPVSSDETQDIVGFLADPSIEADTGRLVGFFVMGQEGLRFLSSSNIRAWGTSVHVRSADVLSPPEELIRLRKHFADSRPFLGQLIRVVGSGRALGRCSDVQFDTRSCIIEWIFPRRFFFSRSPIPAVEIEEVTEEALWIREPIRPLKQVTKRVEAMSRVAFSAS